ncbi:hydroxyethylthiazole kinase [Candidatus Stoquefichus massiliensis]|uniref:hydroxyethylthiazole kinase n=1 Tax=Candidatus Stoquefichus massiliensis TaxID=1470350 RepID=UPI000488E704|nr:hydroxyethylthiazole kinase [Candidatus Stoquefichus massiliensis]
MFEEMMRNVVEKKPLVHCITNTVTMNDCANAILAVKGSPIMADDEKEVEDITSICQGLVLNIGTLNQRTITSMIKAGKKANALGHPVILDPVGAGASPLRDECVKRILEEVQISVIRGNMSEMKAVAFQSSTTRGVDADESDVIDEKNIDDMIVFAKDLSQKTGAIISISGAMDIITNGHEAYVIKNGCPEMSLITGTGCMLSAITGAYVAANPQNPLLATACATTMMGYSGELALKRVLKEELGTGSLRVYLMDYLYIMDFNHLQEGLKIEKR